MRRRVALGLTMLTMLVSQCKFADDPSGGGGTGPTPGAATVALITPNGDDGAVFLTITGPTAPAFTAADPEYRIFRRQVGPGEVRLIIVGNLRNGALLSFQLQDLATLGDYHATVGSVAARTDELRSSLTGYGTNIVGAPTAAR